MRRSLFAAATALALLAPALGYAEQQPAPQGAADKASWRPGPADFKAFTEAGVAGLKAGLQLTPDQEKRWPPVEQAIRDMSQARQDRMAAWRAEGKEEDAIARLRRRADTMTAKANDIKKLADAAEPLYQSLSEDQKHRLRFLVHMAMGHHGGWLHHHGGGWNG